MLRQVVVRATVRRSRDSAGFWAENYEGLYTQVAGYWLENRPSAYMTEEAGLWVDMAELRAEATA